MQLERFIQTYRGKRTFFTLVILIALAYTYNYITHPLTTTKEEGNIDRWKQIGYFNPAKKYDLSPSTETSPIIGRWPWINTLNASSRHIAEQKLKELGYAPAELQDFLSPYFITPVLSSTFTGIPETRSKVDAEKKKVISCVKCQGWMTSHWYKHNVDFASCPYSACEFDVTGFKAPSADAVIFDVEILNTNDRPPHRPPGQLWIAFTEEPPIIYDIEGAYRDQWSTAFNLTYTYRPDADWWSPYGFMVWRDEGAMFGDDHYLAMARKKTKMAVAMISHCPTNSRRMEYITELQKHMDATVLGSCGPPDTKDLLPKGCSLEKHDSYISQFRFYLAFENSFCKGYITEKVLTCFSRLRSMHVVPVVRGGFDYSTYLPPGTFVNAGDFKSTKDLALYLTDLSNDEKRFAQMLKNIDKFIVLNGRPWWCDYCKDLHTRDAPTRPFSLKEWSHERACHPPMDDPIFYPVNPNAKLKYYD